MANYLESDTLRRQANTVVRLTVVTAFGLVGTIVTGFLGMNLLALAEAPLLGQGRLFPAGADPDDAADVLHDRQVETAVGLSRSAFRRASARVRQVQIAARRLEEGHERGSMIGRDLRRPTGDGLVLHCDPRAGGAGEGQCRRDEHDHAKARDERVGDRAFRRRLVTRVERRRQLDGGELAALSRNRLRNCRRNERPIEPLAQGCARRSAT